MRVPQFHSAGILPEALAAAGVLLAAGWRYPFPDDADELRKALLRIFGSTEGSTGWSEPDFLERKFVRHTNPEVLASAWTAAPRTAYPTLRLAIRWTAPDTLPWYLKQLASPAVNATSIFVEVDPLSDLLDWSWPLRIAVLPGLPEDRVGAEIEESLKNLLWGETLVDFVDPSTHRAPLEFLIIPSAAFAEEALLNLPAPLLAHCLILLDIAEESIDQVPMARLMEWTQAKGVLLFSDSSLFAGWYMDFLEQLSHNQPLDLAVASSLWSLGNRVTPVLFASRPLLDGVRLEHHVARLRTRLDQLGDTTIDDFDPNTIVDPSASVLYFSQPPPAPASEVADVLRKHHEQFKYQSERGEASVLSRLTRSVEKAGKEDLEARREAGGRHLQCNVTRREEHEPIRDSFRAGEPHVAEVRIAAPDPDWLGLPEAFPEEKLPPSEQGHLLTVVFSAPNSTPQPLVSTILLPRSGPSSTCRFAFVPSRDAESFDARILVLHENRVLQTARLMGPMNRGGASSGIRFELEGVVRPLGKGLEQRSRYQASFVANHTGENEPQVTTIAGLRATRISLKGLETAIRHIGKTWNDMSWETEPFPAADSPETSRLLRTLSAHGYLLYQELVIGQGLEERLQGNGPIQGIAAQEGSFLPLEFCYTRRPAPIDGEAPLCPNWRVALQNGGGCWGCRDDGTTLCPAAFWGLNRVIEWHRFRLADRKELKSTGDDFALQSEPTVRNNVLKPLQQLLVGASKLVTSAVAPSVAAKLMQVATWKDWKASIDSAGPSLLILMVHTDEKDRLKSIEMGGAWLDPPVIMADIVRKLPPTTDPVVLLLGCGTGVAKAEFQNLSAQFRRAGAAIVVSTIAELHVDHAPWLARTIIDVLAADAGENRSFGEVMLAVRRKSLLEKAPIALVLLSYGDADWRI